MIERTRSIRVGTGTTPTENEFELKEKQWNTQSLLFVENKNRLWKKKPIPSHEERMVGRHKESTDVSSHSSSEEDNRQDWKDRASFLEKENLRLKKKYRS